MGLVDYSDSDQSENDSKSQRSSHKPPPPTKASAAPKSAFSKVVDRANPHKIKVTLPGAAPAVNSDAADASDDLRPAKRAKTGGGFNSFLPAPKNVGTPSNGAISGDGTPRARGVGLGRGINLKTGAAPAFSRAAAPTEAEPEQDIEMNTELQFPIPSHLPEGGEPLSAENHMEMRTEEKQVPPHRTKPMFRPLSVARKPERKKKKPPFENGVGGSSTNNESPVAKTPSDTIATAPTPKRSLFASVDEDHDDVAEPQSNGQYEPYFQTNDSRDDTNDSDAIQAQLPKSTGPNPAPSDLNTLASSLNLTAAERRQLFGRAGAPSDAQITQFSGSQEYSHNQAMLASGEAAAPAHNPVRSIAPGKHSLQQLLNQATSQRDALEESFAAGRRNKKEAGSRYGW